MQALWMLAASLFFATMAVCVKFASAHFHASELLFWRGLIGIVVMGLWARSQRTPLATRYPGMHGWRSLIGVLSLGAWFYAIAGLPLATAMTLNYMSSVWIAAFLVGGSLIAWNPRSGAPLPGRQGALAMTVLAGFAGVVLMLRPSMAQHGRRRFGARGRFHAENQQFLSLRVRSRALWQKIAATPAPMRLSASRSQQRC